jgi:hypothetical protein
MNYSLNFPFNIFSNDGHEMYDKFTKGIKTEYCDHYICKNYGYDDMKEHLYSGELIQVPCSTRVGVDYLFKVTDIDQDKLVTLEWVGLVE